MPVKLVKLPNETDKELRWALVETAWGYIALVCRGSYLYRLILPQRNKRNIIKTIQSEFAAAQRDDGLLPDLQKSLGKYFEGHKVAFDCRIDVSWAGDFAQAVMRECVKIKGDKTISYGVLARRIGRPGAARAVGGVMKSNQVPLIIPCHRVLAADGGLGGYSAAGGVALKKRLLEHERNIYPDG
jgi:methylated-DNA-[protein]-cysteine S-methyltransferase